MARDQQICQAGKSATSGQELLYRPDIDGLRGVAVSAVVLFHAGWQFVPGGFIGVDIFFVISGYLITRLLLVQKGDFWRMIVSFYTRRVRRILPALLVLILFVLFIAHIVLLPSDLRPFMTDVAASTIFVSNFAPQTAVGYFERANDVRPLLHTWSLAIEEQFYLIFPLVLLGLTTIGRRCAAAVILLLTITSFGWSVHVVNASPGAAFFSTHGRAWELGVGSLIALADKPMPASQRVLEWLAVATVVAISAAVVFFSSATPFPGFAAALPVLATALLIQTGGNTLVGAALASAPAVTIGRMSYSIYLWHWPMIVLSEYAIGEKLTGLTLFAVLVLAIGAASLSWRFVEVPFHRRMRTNLVLIFVALTSVSILGTALAGKLANGWPQRFSPAALELAAAAKDFNPRRLECHRTDNFSPPPSRSCLYGSGPVRAAVWGDSHGVELSAAIGERAASRGTSLVELTYTSCLPTLSSREQGGCRRFNAAALQYLLRSSGIGTIILVAKYDDPAVRNGEGRLDGIARSAQILAKGGKRVVLVYPVPAQPGAVPRALALRSQFDAELYSYGTKRADFLRRNATVLAFLDSIQAPGLLRVRPDTSLCDAERCATYRFARVLYFDDNHLSQSGARQLAPLFDPLFR